MMIKHSKFSKKDILRKNLIINFVLNLVMIIIVHFYKKIA